jgi:citrate lyase subunit beta/citryl-CoA lyase
MRSDITSPLANASSFLFVVPGNRPDYFEKALHSGADQVILDLEDGVGEETKGSAREGSCEQASPGPCSCGSTRQARHTTMPTWR